MNDVEFHYHVNLNESEKRWFAFFMLIIFLGIGVLVMIDMYENKPKRFWGWLSYCCFFVSTITVLLLTALRREKHKKLKSAFDARLRVKQIQQENWVKRLYRQDLTDESKKLIVSLRAKNKAVECIQCGWEGIWGDDLSFEDINANEPIFLCPKCSSKYIKHLASSDLLPSK